jgi:pimeloyl-ACP methyl ester carboxylesterase
MEMSECHPFKSPELRDKFLKDYDQRARNWPVPSEAMMIDTSYGKTFVRVCGPADAKPLVLLHGAGVSSLYWIPCIRSLSGHFRVYAIDGLYGTGRSVYTKPIKKVSDYNDWLNELFNAFELGNDVNGMGHSYGSWQISEYAIRFSEKLNKIVLLAPGATVLSIRLEFYIRSLLMLLFPTRFIQSFFMWAYRDYAAIDKDGAKAFIDTALLAFACFKLKRLIIPTVLSNDELKGFKNPTLFLVGQNEKLYSARSAVKRLNTVAPQITTEIIPNAGHDLLYAQTEMVNKKVLEFLMGAKTGS